MTPNTKTRQRVVAVITAVFCIGLGSVLTLIWQSHTRDAQALAGIEALHRLDERISLLNDPRALQAEWTDDAVRLGSDGSIDRGKEEIYVSDRKAFASGLTFINYQPQIREVQVSGRWAYEWGTYVVTFRAEPHGLVESVHGDLLRVMRREPDGAWRFARVMVAEKGS